MKTFLINILKFSVFTIFSAVCLYFLISTLYLYKLDNQRLDENINTLILGDSHSQTAINDSLFKNSVNFSHNSEHYLLTYNVLKLIVKNNPQIRNLILGCSFHNISTFYERCLFNEENKADGISRMLCTRYFSMIDNNSKLLIIENNLSTVLKSFRVIVSNMIKSITDNYSNYQDYQFIGRYYPGIKRVLGDREIKENILWHFYTDSTGTELENFSLLQSEYLKDIISLCKENNIKVYLLNTPVHENCLKQIPQKFISDYYTLMKELEDSENVILFDYHDYAFPDEYFGDGNHLNLLGASVFTPEIMHRLNGN